MFSYLFAWGGIQFFHFVFLFCSTVLLLSCSFFASLYVNDVKTNG